MLSKLQLRTRRSTSTALFAALMTLAPVGAFAQSPEQSSFPPDVFKRVVFDPTTYAPAVVAYDATVRDWKSSQVFFRNGYFENNGRFTISGRPDDVPISYAAGRNRILMDALINLQLSVVNEVADQAFEGMLANRFPDHRRLVRTLGWMERIWFASFISYKLSEAHYRQAAENIARARQLRFR